MFISKREGGQLVAHSWATEYAISLLRSFHLGVRLLFYKHLAATRLLLAPLAFLILFSSFQTARAQSIAVDNTSSAAGPASDVTSLTWSHTVGSGTNRILIVGVSLVRGDATVSSVTYGGVSLTSIGALSDSGNNTRMEMWKLVAPTAGTASIVVTLSAAKRIVGGAVSFTGVNQTVPHGTFASNSLSGGGSSTPSVNVSGASGELVIDTLATQGDADPATASQTQQWSRDTSSGSGADVIGGGSTKAGASSVTMSWTLSRNRPWSIGAVSLKVAPVPNVGLTKSVTPSGSQQPSTDLAYTVTFTNTGTAAASSFVITDAIPSNTDFKVGSETHSLGTTGLTVTVAYSNNGGSTYAYTPASGGGGAPSGYDRSVTNIRWTFTGNLSQTPPNNPGSVAFTVSIR